jgi:1-deoxy-D-xylulose-5-phosphate reductoisomerase
MSTYPTPAKAVPGRIAVLGSTGSIGRQTLQVVRDNPEQFKVAALTAKSDVELLAQQVREFRPEYVALVDPAAAEQLRTNLGAEAQVGVGEEGLCRAATWPSAHTVVCAVVGFAGFAPLLAAISEGKHVALANKESLVAAGPLVNMALKRSSSVIVPVDSEHNSVFQCILGRGNTSSLRRIILTASGGPFLNVDQALLRDVRPKQAVAHPRWSMKC